MLTVDTVSTIILPAEPIKAEPKNTDMKAINEFLANWKAKAVEYYLGLYAEWRNLNIPLRDCEAVKSWEQKLTKAEVDLVERIHIDKLSPSGGGLLDKILDRDVEAKRDKLVARISKKAGEVVDVSGLGIGTNGEINGIVIGTTGTVSVETITAGGYNIQCLHYRILVK
jgi:hypothetical protein